mgnify:CR=1 FL=1
MDINKDAPIALAVGVSFKIKRDRGGGMIVFNGIL